MNCPCCAKCLTSISGPGKPRRQIGDYCDIVCYAAAHTLTRDALLIWRGMCWKLDVSPTRPIS